MTESCMSGRDWGLLGLLAALFGSSFLLTELVLNGYPSVTAACLRAASGALFLSLALWNAGRRLPRGFAVWSRLAVMGLLANAMPFAFLALGQSALPSSVTAMVNASVPLFSVLLAHLFTTDQKATAAKLAGVVLGFLGVLTMSGREMLEGAAQVGIGYLAVLVAALSIAAGGLWGRRLAELSAAQAAAGMTTTAALWLLPAALMVDGLPSDVATGPTFALMANGLIGTALAYTLYFVLLRRVGASNLMLVTFLMPAVALVLGVMLLDEQPGFSDFLGFSLVLAGLALIDERVRSATAWCLALPVGGGALP